MDFKTKFAEAKTNLICLKFTKTITKDDLLQPEWIYLADQYAKNQDSEWVVKALISLTNSLITQRRVYFTITRDSFRDLVKSDTNWKTPIGLRDDNWSVLKMAAYNIGLFRKDAAEAIVRGKKRSIYELVSPSILDLILVNKEAQKAETLKFIGLEQISKENTDGTVQGTEEGTQIKTKSKNIELDVVPSPSSVGQASVSKSQSSGRSIKFRKPIAEPLPETCD